jgi:RNA polymerase sigma-70 factor (ECF subfamily)
MAKSLPSGNAAARAVVGVSVRPAVRPVVAAAARPAAAPVRPAVASPVLARPVVGTFPPPASSKRKSTVSAEDHRLITDCLKGRPDAFGELVRRYQDRLYNTVYRLVGHPEDAQDVVQDTFLNAYQSLNNFKQESQLFTWLYRIAINTAISHKRKHRNVLSIDAGRNGEGGMEPFDGSVTSRPGHAMERAEEERSVQDALNRLSSEHRIVLILKDMEDLKYEEIADILDVPIGTVRSRLHRARQELRDVFKRTGKE